MVGRGEERKKRMNGGRGEGEKKKGSEEGSPRESDSGFNTADLLCPSISWI